jgi:hypothetical protein
VVWTARVAWIVLPFTTGAAFEDVIQPWSRAPQTVAEVLLWAAWFAGLIALLAPRPWGFTILRVIAPCTVAIAIASAWSAPWLTAVLAIATASFAMVTALSSALAHACAASTAYGPEQRFPLRVPVSLLAGPLPIAVALIGAGVASGPLLLASGNIIAGVVASAVGAPVVAALVRSLSALDHRWLVLVPAGLVVVDPLTFPDPVLLPREHIRSLGLAPGGSVGGATERHGDGEILVGGSGPLLITCRETGSFLRRAGRANATVDADRLRVSPVRADAVVEAAGAHRITVG